MGVNGDATLLPLERALMARDRAVESWLLQAVGPAYDALKANPVRAVSIDQVRSRLASVPPLERRPRRE